MALNTVARVSLENTVAYNDKVGHNSVTEYQSYGTEGSTSVTEKQNSGTEGSKSIPGKHNSRTEEEEFEWKAEGRKSEWIGKLESRLQSTASCDARHRHLVMKLQDYQRKPEEHYTPQQWRFGLHNRDLQTSTTVHNPDLQTSTTVGSTTGSEALKISLAAAFNLKSKRWEKFCDKVVHKPEEMARLYGLHATTTNFSRKEVQSLLTLDALTLLLPSSNIEIFSKLIDDEYPVGCFHDCAHIFACVYKILTTFQSKEPSLPTKCCPHIFGCVYKIPTTFDCKKSSPATKLRRHEDETKESASDREKRRHARCFGNHSKALDIPGTLQIDLEQPGDCELQMSTFEEVDVELNALHHVMPTVENEPDRNVPRMDYERGADLKEFLPPVDRSKNELYLNEFPSQMDRSKIEPGRKVGPTRMME
ncbi:unnamed protein product [Sphagnum troendelagicum]